MLRLGAYLRLIRPANLALMAVGVLLGGTLAAEGQLAYSENVRALLTASIAAVLVGAGGNSINDVFDHRIDAINRPDRPLPSGTVSVGAARGLWVVTTVLGIIIAASVSLAHFAVAVLAALLLYVYSARLKRQPFAGNALISFVVALSIIFGALAIGRPAAAYVAAGFAFLMTFARELVKDIDDQDGDRRHGARTAPIVFGTSTTRLVAAAVIILTVLLTPIPFLVMEYGPLFLFIVLFADLMLLRVVWLLPRSPQNGRAASTWLKTAMVVGLAALFAA